MIDATVPTVPSYDDNVEEKPVGQDGLIGLVIRTFARHWYEYFKGIWQFMIAVRASPKQLLQADLARFTAKLQQNKTQPGVQIWITDFGHVLRWDGAAWDFAPGTERSNWYALFQATGDPPGTGWHLADGATVTYLRSTGDLGTVTIQTIANTWYRR